MTNGNTAILGLHESLYLLTIYFKNLGQKLLSINMLVLLILSRSEQDSRPYFGQRQELISSHVIIKYHCVKSVQIRSFFWSVFSRIRTEYFPHIVLISQMIILTDNATFPRIGSGTGVLVVRSNFSRQVPISSMQTYTSDYWRKFYIQK